jgi:hypothetical protein
LLLGEENVFLLVHTKEKTLSNSAKLNVEAKNNKDNFKMGYDQIVLQDKSTVVLSTSFHLINIILMGLCSVFKKDKGKPGD